MRRSWVGARGLCAPTLCALISLVGAQALGAARIPINDGVVLEHVPQAAMTTRLEPLRARLRQDPGDRAAAITLARAYIELGRAAADPRFVSYAQAVLAPWQSAAEATPETLVLGATVLQYLHRFNDALAVLDRALRLEPQNSQALLTKATLLLVQGRLTDARQACRPLIQAAGQLIAIACLAEIDSRAGRLSRSYEALHAVFHDDVRLPVELRAWILGSQAEMAVRRGYRSVAEAHYRAALAVAPNDVYLKADYADLLLLEKRHRDVIELLRGNEAQDVLLLRLAIAGRGLGSSMAARWNQMFRARFEAARRDEDFTHLREQARYFLDVAFDPRHALELARSNWAVQREPSDVRIYLLAAVAARSAPDERVIRDWIDATGYEDDTLRGVLSSFPAPRQ